MSTFFTDSSEYIFLQVQFASSRVGVYNCYPYKCISDKILLNKGASNVGPLIVPNCLSMMVPMSTRGEMLTDYLNKGYKSIPLYDIEKIIPIGSNKLIITLDIDGDISEVYCSSIEYGIIDNMGGMPRCTKRFINLHGDEKGVELIKKHYYHFNSISLEYDLNNIISIEAFSGRTKIVSDSGNDFGNPRSASNHFGVNKINHIVASINKSNRTIHFYVSDEDNYIYDDHDGGYVESTTIYHAGCTVFFCSLQKMQEQLDKYKEKGFEIPYQNGSTTIQFEATNIKTVELKLGLRFGYSNNSSEDYISADEYFRRKGYR